MVQFLWPVMTKVDIHFCHVRMYVSWMIFKLDLEIIQTNCWNSDGYKLHPSRSRFILYCYERDFMDSLNHEKQADVIEAFGYGPPLSL